MPERARQALRRAPRLAFSEAVSAGDWTLTDPEGTPHVIDGPVRRDLDGGGLLDLIERREFDELWAKVGDGMKG